MENKLNPINKVLGADRTSHLMAYVYGCHHNGYSTKDICQSASVMFRVELSFNEIRSIIHYMEFEVSIADKPIKEISNV